MVLQNASLGYSARKKFEVLRDDNGPPQVPARGRYVLSSASQRLVKFGQSYPVLNIKFENVGASRLF